MQAIIISMMINTLKCKFILIFDRLEQQLDDGKDEGFSENGKMVSNANGNKKLKKISLEQNEDSFILKKNEEYENKAGNADENGAKNHANNKRGIQLAGEIDDDENSGQDQEEIFMESDEGNDD